MTFAIKVPYGSDLYNAAALRELSTNPYEPLSARLELAQQSSDQYADSLSEVMTILLTAFGTLEDGKDKEGDPIAIAKEMAERIGKLREAVKHFSGGCAVLEWEQDRT